RLVQDVTTGGEVEACVAAADGAEPQAGLERDAAALEERLARFVAGAKGRAVEPGQEGRLGRVPGQHGEALTQQPGEPGPAVAEGGEELVEPGLPGGERGDRGDNAEMPDAPPGVGREPVSQRGHAWCGGDHGGTFQAGQVPGLAG